MVEKSLLTQVTPFVLLYKIAGFALTKATRQISQTRGFQSRPTPQVGFFLDLIMSLFILCDATKIEVKLAGISTGNIN